MLPKRTLQLVIAGVQRASPNSYKQANTHNYPRKHGIRMTSSCPVRCMGVKGMKSMRKREADLTNPSWFFMWRLIINLVVLSHLSLTFPAIYLTSVNTKNSCAHMHKHTYTCLHQPNLLFILCPPPRAIAYGKRIRTRCQRTMWEGRFTTRKTERQFSSEKTEMAIPHQALTWVMHTNTELHRET